MNDPLRVLFAHGLESGPDGNKPRNLRAAGFEVVARQMPSSLAVAPRASACGQVLAARRAFRRSLAVQRDALASAPPGGLDVVVGSSFGGAIALELVLHGAWRGPTLLLCPAHERVAERARTAVPPPLSSVDPAIARQVLVVHGRADAIVPIDHSRRLVAGSEATLIEVDDDHRLSATATVEGLRTWVLTSVSRTRRG